MAVYLTQGGLGRQAAAVVQAGSRPAGPPSLSGQIYNDNWVHKEPTNVQN